MPIQLECPKCQKQASVPDGTVGKSVKCTCGVVFQVPMAMAQHPAPASAHPISALKCTCCGANFQVPANTDRYACSFCGTSFSVNRQDDGTSIEDLLQSQSFPQSSPKTLHCDYCGGNLNPSGQTCDHCGQVPTILVEGTKLSGLIEKYVRDKRWNELFDLTLNIEKDYPTSSVAWAGKGLAILYNHVSNPGGYGAPDLAIYCFEMSKKSATQAGFVRELNVKASDLCLFFSKRKWQSYVNDNVKEYGREDAWERYDGTWGQQGFQDGMNRVVLLAELSAKFDPNKKAAADALVDQARHALAAGHKIPPGKTARSLPESDRIGVAVCVAIFAGLIGYVIHPIVSIFLCVSVGAALLKWNRHKR